MPTPLLRQELNFILANPSRHDQEVWIELPQAPGDTDLPDATMDDVLDCGTVGCLAGWTVIHHAPDKALRWVRDGSLSMHDEARELLGLSSAQADILFGQSRTVDELEALVDALETNPDLSEDQMWSIIDSVTDGCQCGCQIDD